MTTWIDIFNSYENIEYLEEILQQLSKIDINYGINILIDMVSNNIMSNYILEDMRDIIKLFYKYDAEPNIDKLFEIDDGNVDNIIENFKIRGMLIDIITELYEIELDDETIEQWANIKSKKLLSTNFLTGKRLLKYLKYCSKFLTQIVNNKQTQISDLPNVLKGLIGQYIIEKYENKWLDEYWGKFNSLTNILENPNAIDFIKNNIQSFKKDLYFLVHLAKNTNSEAFEIMKNYCFNKNIYQYKDIFEKYRNTIAQNQSDGAIDFLINYYSFFTNDIFTQVRFNVIGDLDLLVILSKNPNDKAIDFFIKNYPELKVKYRLLLENPNPKVVPIIEENIKNWDLKNQWSIWKFNNLYFYKTIEFINFNWNILPVEINRILSYVNKGLYYNIDKLNDKLNNELNKYNISKILDFLRNKWDILDITFKTEEFWSKLAITQSDEAIKLLREKWTEVIKTEEFWNKLVVNINDEAVQLIKDKWNEIELSDVNVNEEFFNNLSKNSNVKALEILKSKWSNINKNNTELMLFICKNLASHNSLDALLFLREIRKFVRNFNVNWGIWRNLFKNPHNEAISFIIDNWKVIIKTEWISYRNFWRYLFKNPNDKLIEFLEVECQLIMTNLPINYNEYFLIYLLNNKNKKAIRLFEKLVIIFDINITKSTSIKYLTNPNIFDLVKIPVNNQYVELLNI